MKIHNKNQRFQDVLVLVTILDSRSFFPGNHCGPHNILQMYCFSTGLSASRNSLPWQYGWDVRMYQEPYGLLNFSSAALSTIELWWRMNHQKSFRTLFKYTIFVVLEKCTEYYIRSVYSNIQIWHHLVIKSIIRV